MAVAVGVAVEMGPRNRRRLLKVGVLALGLTALLATLLLTRQPSPGNSGAAGHLATASGYGPDLVFGMTRQRVERITGAPTKIQGSCLLFRPKGGMVGAIPILRTYPVGDAWGYLKLCFFNGVLASAARWDMAEGGPSPNGQRPRAKYMWVPWHQNPFEW